MMKDVFNAFINIILSPVYVVYGIYVIVTMTKYEEEQMEHIAEPIPYFAERSYETEIWLKENGLK